MRFPFKGKVCLAVVLGRGTFIALDFVKIFWRLESDLNKVKSFSRLGMDGGYGVSKE